jgi:hypothetical protein
LAGLLVAVALAMKSLVPTGYMVGTQDRVLTMMICGDASGEQFVKQVIVPQSGKSVGHAGGSQSKAAEPCPYASAAGAALGPVDLLLLALALAFILLLGFAPVRVPVLRGASRLRPPLRGPPVLI